MLRSHIVDYDQVAQMQLDASIDHFKSGTLAGFICATTLAHAAKGILEGLLPRRELSSFNAMKKDLAENPEVIESLKEDLKVQSGKKIESRVGDFLHAIPNALKHFCPENVESSFDPRASAYCSIFLALDDYAQLKGALTNKMIDFRDEWLHRGEEIAGEL